jgi:hypothetical protein
MNSPPLSVSDRVTNLYEVGWRPLLADDLAGQLLLGAAGSEFCHLHFGVGSFS